MRNFNRREFFAAMAAGMVVTAEGLWMPGEKLISIPSHRYFAPAGSLAWMDRAKREFVEHHYEIAKVMLPGGKIIEIPEYFDVEIRGAELVRDIERV